MRVLIVDDHRLFREGLEMLLRPLAGDHDILQAESAEEAIALLERERDIALVLMDLVMPGLHGVDGIREIRGLFPDLPVVALSSSDDRVTVLKALDAGAMGFIPKSSSTAILLGALQLVLAHGIYLPPAVFLADRALSPDIPHQPTRRAADGSPAGATGMAGATGITGTKSAKGEAETAREAATPQDLGLTPRQVEVLHLLLQGKSAKLIGRELSLSASTVKAHTSAVLRALNVTTRTQAVIAAARRGLSFRE